MPWEITWKQIDEGKAFSPWLKTDRWGKIGDKNKYESLRVRWADPDKQTLGFIIRLKNTGEIVARVEKIFGNKLHYFLKPNTDGVRATGAGPDNAITEAVAALDATKP